MDLNVFLFLFFHINLYLLLLLLHKSLLLIASYTQKSPFPKFFPSKSHRKIRVSRPNYRKNKKMEKNQRPFGIRRTVAVIFFFFIRPISTPFTVNTPFTALQDPSTYLLSITRNPPLFETFTPFLLFSPLFFTFLHFSQIYGQIFYKIWPILPLFILSETKVRFEKRKKCKNKKFFGRSIVWKFKYSYSQIHKQTFKIKFEQRNTL